MKTDQGGCSTCPAGEELFEISERRGRNLYCYDYRTPGGKLFSCVGFSLEQCREKRDNWLLYNAIYG